MKESIRLPKNPARPPNKMTGHWGGALRISFDDTVRRRVTKYDNPTVAPPIKLASKPAMLTPPFVPAYIYHIYFQIYFAAKLVKPFHIIN